MVLMGVVDGGEVNTHYLRFAFTLVVYSVDLTPHGKCEIVYAVIAWKFPNLESDPPIYHE